jgi:hypothetical protein
MSGPTHCEVYEAFLAVKNLKVGITYDKKVNLRILQEKTYNFLWKK